MRHLSFAGILLLIISLQSCQGDMGRDSETVSSTSQKLFRAVPSSESQLDFKNEVKESAFRNSMFFDYFLNGGGVAVGDVNNDGLPDIFFTGNDTENRLYINEGHLSFKDVSKTALPAMDNWSTGANMVDINRDGYLDIYVCNSGMDESKWANSFLINNGDLTFTDKAAEYGVAGNEMSVHSSFFDFDKDGDLDLWVNNHLNYDGNVKNLVKNQQKSDNERKSVRSRLYRNDGGTFTDVTEQAGVSREMAALGVVTSDLNDDGWVDVYVSNDYDIPDYYFLNNGNGTFTDVSKEKIGHTSFYSMGIDAADINNDGVLDMVAVDMTPNDHVRNKVLMASMDSRKFNFLYDQIGFTKAYMFNSVQMGRGGGNFSEVGNYMGTSQTEWSWAPLIADFDNDGLKDLYITNGYLRDTKDNDFKRKVEEYKQKNGGQWNEKVYSYFEDIITSSPVKNAVFRNDGDKMENVINLWSDLPATFSNGAAYADFDQDGDLDLIINNLSQEASLLENLGNSHNSLRLKLNNGGKETNAVVKLQANGIVQRQDYTFSRGYQSSVEPVLHFGMGKSTKGTVIVEWIDGSSESFQVNASTKVVSLTKGKGQMIGSETPEHPLFTLSKLVNTTIMHKEMQFDDFAKEVLLPHKYSDLGPALAVADIDGDGNDEIFLGGSNTSEPVLLRIKDGKYKVSTQSSILNDKKYEDLGALFFDYNGDGHLDLYVASGGGGEIEKYPGLNQDRLYENDGNGNFKSVTEKLPLIGSSTKAVVAIDADHDGDMDLLIGGRNTPGKYPLKAQSYYLENSNGIFRDRTSKVIKDLPEMITDITIVDANGDNQPDLAVTSEWEEPFIFINTKGHFERHSIGKLDGHSGWWQSVTAADIDGDGDQDMILGNMGENTKFHPSQKKPLGVLASDFDDSGSLDIVLTKKYKDKTVPTRGKECSSQQMPMISEKFPTYEGFATSSIHDILGEDKIEQAYSKQVVDFSSYIAINDGTGSFTTKKLPSEAQWFPVMDVEMVDANSDGLMDLVLVGNKFNAEPETPSYDAGRGLVLIQSNDNVFSASSLVHESGLNIKHDMRAIRKVSVGGEQYLSIANNNGPLLFYKLTR